MLHSPATHYDCVPKRSGGSTRKAASSLPLRRNEQRESSLVKAGPIPALYRGRFHDGKGWVESWRVAIARPGEDSFCGLAKGTGVRLPTAASGWIKLANSTPVRGGTLQRRLPELYVKKTLH
jgi:hypothetical protein